MPRYLNTTFDPALDRELDDLRALVTSLAAKVQSLGSSATSTVSSVTTVQQTFVVSSADGATVIQAGSLQVTTGSGLTLGQSGDAALLGLALTAGTGIGIAGATISNSGVTSWNGSTGAVTYAPAVTTKGDLFTYSTIPARLAVGTNGYVLSADSTQTTGLAWIPAPTGGGGTWTVDNSYAPTFWAYPTGGPILPVPIAAIAYRVNCTAPLSVVINLPTSSNYPVCVKRIDGSVHTLDVQGQGGATIDGAASYSMPTQWQSATFLFDGTNWFVL